MVDAWTFPHFQSSPNIDLVPSDSQTVKILPELIGILMATACRFVDV